MTVINNMRVKPLVWIKNGLDGWVAVADTGDYYVYEAMKGAWLWERINGKHGYRFGRGGNDGSIRSCEAAIAAVEADRLARILAALEPAGGE